MAMAKLGHNVTVLHRAGTRSQNLEQVPGLHMLATSWPRIRGGSRIFPFLFARHLASLLALQEYDWLLLRVTPHPRILSVVQQARIPVGAYHIGEEHVAIPAVRAVAPKLSLVVTNSERTAATLTRELGIAPEHIMVTLFSGVAPELFSEVDDTTTVRRRYGLDSNSFLISHASSFRLHHDFETLFQAVTMLKFPYEIALIGTGTRINEIRERAIQLGVIARFLGSLPLRTVSEVLTASDACVDPVVHECTQLGNLRPAKLWEYMASGTPAVETINPAAPLPAWAIECLGLVPCENPTAMADKLRDIKQRPDVWRDKAAMARDWVIANQSWSHIAADCIAFMETVTRSGVVL